MSAVNVVRWLRECYREDRARAGVGDFLGDKVIYHRLLKGREELASDWMPEVLLPPSYGEKAGSHAALYRREQEVVYACLFLCGHHGGRPRRAPLIFYQAEFAGDGYTALRIDASRWRINPVALEMLETNADQITDILRGGELSEGVIGSIRDWIEPFGVQVDALWKWPELSDRNAVNAAAQQPQLSLLPAAAVGVIPRSITSRGVIDELETLAALGPDEWSKPLRIMLGVEPMKTYSDPPDSFMAVPALLSQSQERILASSRVNPVTLCHGPPGTGKSFTIAAIALNHVARGETVLIASGKDHAVNVVHDKIDTMLGGEEVTVRAGRKDHLSQLKRFIDACLAGQMTSEQMNAEEMSNLFLQVEETMRQLHHDERKLEAEWSKALARGEVMAKPDPNILERIKRAWAIRQVKDRYLLLELTAHLNDLYVQRERQLRNYLRKQRKYLLGKALEKSTTRKDFKMMLQALRKYRGSEQEEVFRKMNVSSVLAALPVWLVNLDDLHRVLPMQKELFDVAVIDEASQCDLASVLPLMLRAKRLVIAGDACQLRHMSFLAKSRQVTLAEELGVLAGEQEVFNYRDVSLMDHAASMVASADQTGFLNEHFRSSPRIIAFSNRRFYQNTLQIMRERPWEEQCSSLRGRLCQGTRDELGVNQAEVDLLLEDLERFVKECSCLPLSRRPSVGILSPFRNQVEAIRETLGEHFNQRTMGLLFEDHQLLIGTAHSFQGEERDLMLISLCVDRGVGSSTLRFIEREDVFNVSITRARSQQHIYHSLEAGDLKHDSLLASYLRELYADGAGDEHDSQGDRFAVEVAEAFRERGLKVMLSRRVAGVSIDVLLVDGDRVLGLDLLGYPGESYPAVDLHRAKILRRAGFRLLPLGYTEWITQKSYAMSSIIHELRYDTRYHYPKYR